MRTFKAVLLASFMAAGVAGCDLVSPEFTNEDPVTGPALGDVSSSGCKLSSGLQERSLIDGNMIEAVAYDTSVTIIHHDAYYQCNADITFEMEVNGEELVLREVDKSVEVTNCMCPFDLSVGINNLTPGKTYHVTVWDEFETKMFGEVWVTVGNCQQQCYTDEDCWNYPDMPRLDCEGKFACVDGACNYYCENPNPNCTSDAECPQGYQCVFYGYAADGTMTGADQAMPAYQCQADADCPEGMWCELLTDCACPPDVDCDCMPYGNCVTGELPKPWQGVCEPIVVNNECFSDTDCGSGYHCEFYYATPMNGGASDAAGVPYQEEMPPNPECACTEEWAPVCGFDGITYSNDCFAYCSGVEIAYWGECQTKPQSGVCVPDQNPGCYSNADCDVGMVCQLTDWCAGTDPNADGVIDPTWCMGKCVPATAGTCEELGGVCIPMAENGACPDGFNWVYGNAYDPGTFCSPETICCVPVQVQECYSVDDCYKIYGTEPVDPSTGMPWKWDCVEGRCVQIGGCDRYTCYADSDCGVGFACIGTGYCDESGMCCNVTECVPVEIQPCSSNSDCMDGQVCANGWCTSSQECRPDDTGMCACGGLAGIGCPADMQCVYDGPDGCMDCFGHCYPITQEYCNDDSMCGAGQVCMNGVCTYVEQQCGDDASCPEGQVCMNGVCTAQQECRYDATGMCLCGGYSGFVCPTGQACVYDVDCDPATGNDCMGHCYATPECVCDQMYAPVCGADGVTYGNKCAAACANVEVVSEGECAVPVCPDMPYQECASGEKMYCRTDAAGCTWCECYAAN